MNMNFAKYIALGGFALSPLATMAGGDGPGQPWEAPAANGTQFHTQVRIDVDKDTDLVIIKQDDNMPGRMTKAFEVQNADVYELRPYIRAAIQGTRISGVAENVLVECAKYDDGTGILVVTATADRFGPQPNGGQSIEELVRELDQPNITSSSGRQKIIFFPENDDADWVAEMVDKLFIRGSLKSNGSVLTSQDAKDAELQGGHELVTYDKDLNAVYVEATPNNVDRVKAFMQDYAGGTNPSYVMCDLTLYEVSMDNDLDFGNDFLAWKAANPTAALEISEALDQYKVAGAIDSEYVEFLASKGYAKAIKNYSSYIYDDASADIKRLKTFHYETDSSAAESTTTTTTTSTEYWDDTNGNNLFDGSPGDTLIVTDPEVAPLAAAYDFVRTVSTPATTTTAAEVTYTPATKVVGLEISIEANKYGKAATLTFDIKSTGIQGFTKTGTPIDWNSEIKAEVAFAKETKNFAIGGIEEKIVTREIDKVPFFGSLPIIGSLFSKEVNVVKSRRIVAVCNVRRMNGVFEPSEKVKKAVEQAQSIHKTEKVGENRPTLTPFKDQFFMDEVKSVDETIEQTVDEIKYDTEALLNR